MGDLIAVFNMQEVSIETRIRLIKKLGAAINFEYAANFTEDVVNELVGILESKAKGY